jgi:hypothetical protein
MPEKTAVLRGWRAARRRSRWPERRALDFPVTMRRGPSKGMAELARERVPSPKTMRVGLEKAKDHGSGSGFTSCRR